jgi:hypothetical protein
VLGPVLGCSTVSHDYAYCLQGCRRQTLQGLSFTPHLQPRTCTATVLLSRLGSHLFDEAPHISIDRGPTVDTHHHKVHRCALFPQDGKKAVSSHKGLIMHGPQTFSSNLTSHTIFCPLHCSVLTNSSSSYDFLSLFLCLSNSLFSLFA